MESLVTQNAIHASLCHMCGNRWADQVAGTAGGT